jgi:hypothetical protein
VDAMVAAGEIPIVRLRGIIVRFYLPDVVRHLTATVLVSKRGCARRVAGEGTKGTEGTKGSRNCR